VGASFGDVLVLGAALSFVNGCTLNMGACDFDGDNDGESI